MGKPHRVFGNTGPERSSGAAHEENVTQSGFAILLDSGDRFAKQRWQFLLHWTQSLIQFVVGAVLARGAHHQQSEFRPRNLGIESLKNRKRVFDIRTAPRSAGLGNPEVATRSGAVTLHLDPSFPDSQQLSRLMLREHAGDMVVDH